jgi:choline dehydrogenase-like flavoprotein
MSPAEAQQNMYDVIIIGSGFGGSMVAHVLVSDGYKVLMIERGSWVSRGRHNWEKNGSVDLTPYYTLETPVRVIKGGNRKIMGLYSCVGGPSVFYGGVSFRFREADFHPSSEIRGDSEAEWPFDYHDLETYYTQAEHILSVAGIAFSDPTEPPRSQPYPQEPPALSHVSRRIYKAAEQLGLHPFHLPLAINYSDNGRQRCIACTTCDTFACAIEAKNDLATVVIKPLLRKGLDLISNMVVTQLQYKNGKIINVLAVDKKTMKRYTFHSKYVVLSAGALASPHILLSSGLQDLNPAGHLIGRFLMRHVNSIVFGIFPYVVDRENRFHKQIGINDFYFGHPQYDYPSGKLGSIQQVQTPPRGLIESQIYGPWGKLISTGVKLLAGLLTIAEDQPQFDNKIMIDRKTRDSFGLPQLYVRHKYSKRDLAANRILIRQAKRILRQAGAILFYIHHIRTFSHAVGTIRMGRDPKKSVLDPYCKFRGIKNLFVVDGSSLPTSAGLNPSLTIAANALRVAEYMKNII